jgi:hypothetical protein
MKPFAKSVFLNVTGLGLLALSSSIYAMPMLSFSVSDLTPSIGETISVDIVATDVTDLFAFNVDFAFNSTVLGGTSVVPGTFLNSAGLTLGDLGLLGFDTTTPGEIRDINDSLLGAVAGATGTGVLATMSFDVVGSGISDLSFLNVNALAVTELIDSVGQTITVADATGTTVTVPSVPEPPLLLLMGTGVVGLLVSRRRKSSRQ